MAYTEFYTNASTGANINAGDLTANGIVTSTNGAWSTVTNIFTATAGTPFSGVSVGDFASLYVDGGTVSVYIARVTAVGGGGLTLTLSTTAKSGTAPTTAGVGISCTTGGAWKGPNGAEAFPFGFIAAAMTNAAADTVCVNMKNGTNYAITANITHNIAGPVRFHAYTTTVRDGGRCTLDGGTSGASYILLTLGASAANVVVSDMICQNNGATGSQTGLSYGAGDGMLRRVVVNSVRGTGIALTVDSALIQCETYACNQSNTANLGGITASAGTLLRCISHDNTGSNNLGIRVSGGSVAVMNCIADTNGKNGFDFTATANVIIIGCDAYNNGTDGIALSTASSTQFYAENCILTKNGGYGINLSGSTRTGTIRNCVFGAGTQANSSGTINAPSGVLELGTITLDPNIDPYTDAANGDFRLNNTAGGGAFCRGAGTGAFTQTAASYAGTVGFPDVGAAQHLESASGGLLNHPGMTGNLNA